MTDSTRLLSVIQSLEVQLHQPATRNDVNIVGALLHEDFEEIGRSGQRYDKQQTVAALKMENGQRQIFAGEFKLAIVAEGVALLTYKSFQHDAGGKVVRRTERSSIWLLSSPENGGRWQLRFHQGTASSD